MSATKVSELLNLFVSLSELGDGTVELYQQAVDKLIDCLGDVEAAAIRPLDAQAVLCAMKAGRSPTTVNIQMRCLKRLFNWMVESEVIAASPFAKVKSLRETRRGHTPYTETELAQLISACPDQRWRLIVALAITTGMRRGEILNLTVGEIDYLAGAIQIAPKSQSAATWQWSIKDRDSRQVPINGALEGILLRRQAELPDGQPYVCLTPQRYRHLIVVQQRLGKLPYDQRKCPECNFVRSFQEICRRAGVPYRMFHATRGTGLTVMAEKGLQPHDIAKIAGHSDIRTTYQYYVRCRQSELLEKARSKSYNF
jgi:integrase